jgi:hypothetical protein
LKALNVLEATRKVDERADLGRSQQFSFVTLAMLYPFSVKLCAMDLAEEAVLQDPLAAELPSSGTKNKRGPNAMMSMIANKMMAGNLKLRRCNP